MESLKARDDTKSEIQTFFKGLNIFLTGGTGAVGQVLLEKLLRSCPISNVFLLVREKKNKSPETRIDELFNMPLFDRLKVVQPNFIRKITLVIGDCEKPDLGLSEEDKALLVARVDVVIHCAATVNFIEPLRRTTFINVRSTRDLLLLARRMNGLKVFVYVSSAFSNCNRNYIDEIIYENHIQGDTLIEMAENMTDSAMDSITNKLLKNWPNTYTLSKCIAENIVQQYGSGMPICITRPGIVVSTYDDPVLGWVNNFVGVNGLTLGAGLGAIRVVLANNIKLAVVPSDRVANAIISSAWHTGVVGYGIQE
ncbi:fatty acyl-CoA reductase 1-like isoform X2 [Sipha flava]|uniref:Fatty acyl-CoA reductase n=1 Tax=Sipha flava TaxID=143950 RepID=A0A8B8FC80_9HEMI|nr:fatty acyl-CoA reductase 1-like isoform X2 [Sipha flava]